MYFLINHSFYKELIPKTNSPFTRFTQKNSGFNLNLADLASMYGFGGGSLNRKPALDIKNLINPEFSSTTTPPVFNYANLAGLANLAGFGNLLRDAGETTTKAPGFNLGNLFGSSTGTGTSSNTILSILNLLSGSGAGASSIASLTPFLSLLPLDQLFQSNNPQANLGLITSLPQIISLIQSFNNFKLPVTNVS